MLKNIIVLLLVCFSFSSIAKVKVKFGTVAPSGTPWAQTLEDIKTRVNKASKGDIKIKVYLGGQLGGELEILQKIRRGNVQGGGLTSAALASVIPELDVLELPYLFESYEEADFVLDNYLFEDFKKLFEEKGIILVSWAENGWRNIGHKEKAILSPKDLQGEKMRSQESKVHLAFWKTLNASPQAISTTEVLPALQTGVVKGFDNTPLFTLAAEWHTTIKHYTMSKHIYQPAAVVYSARFWKKLDDAQKNILLDKRNQLAVESRAQVRALGSELVEVLKSSGIQVYDLSKDQKKTFKDLLVATHKDLVKQIGGKAQDIYIKILQGKKDFQKK